MEAIAGKPGLGGEAFTAAQMLEQKFTERLQSLLSSSVIGGGPVPVPVVEQVLRRAAQLEPQCASLVANDMDRMNVRFAVLAAAGVSVLEPMCGTAQAMAMVDECLNQPLRAEVLEGTRAMLDAAPDPFAALVAVSKAREQSYFGASFEFSRPLDDAFAYVLDIRRCLFHEALKAVGRADLQRVLCQFDLNWVDAIEPARHRLRFVRPCTFATASMCRMCFLRLESGGPDAGEERAPDGAPHG